MKVSVILFPGSNCDHDVVHVYRDLLEQEVEVVWHKETSLKGADLVVIPGGFSFGDYLRTGALAKLSPIMPEVRKFAESGGRVIGICNGFQILCESGLLPGVLLQNKRMRFLSRFLHMRVERSDTPFTRNLKAGSLLTCPVAHFDGNFFCDDQTLEKLEKNGQVVFRYADESGRVEETCEQCNPNGSRNSIAGICNEKRNVIGLMPHPERIAEGIVGYLGGSTGIDVFASSLT
jgi:phosphoribosylformylglycinamidine synthase subunit PurQ / glutaminase